ncbi:MAG: fibronectin type III domain-containing protein, partial [Oscillospiraceae bacterium]|nr:fibronectin type III domain-containing protein [Oscillospiraceae bacterium]
GATGYRVFQYDTKTKKYVTLKTITGTSYTVTKLKSGTSYKFAVKAYSTVNGKVYWASGYKTVTATTNPGTPTLKVIAGSGKAVLSWNKQTGATGYVVYMATSKNGKYSKIATLKSNSKISYTKTGLARGKTYYFKVIAYKTVGSTNIYGAYSSVKNVKVK